MPGRTSCVPSSAYRESINLLDSPTLFATIGSSFMSSYFQDRLKGLIIKDHYLWYRIMVPRVSPWNTPHAAEEPIPQRQSCNQPKCRCWRHV